MLEEVLNQLRVPHYHGIVEGGEPRVADIVVDLTAELSIPHHGNWREDIVK